MATATKSSAKPAAKSTKDSDDTSTDTKATSAKSSAKTTAAKTAAKNVEPTEAPYDNGKIVSLLSHFLADSYFVYVKTQGYHWNVRGPQFYSLHLLFESQYQNFADAIDTIAERIRGLGADAPGSFAQFRKLSDVVEATGVPTANEMVADLAQEHEKLSKQARKIIASMDKADDDATADLVTDRLRFHDQSAWMLRSSLA